jgi:sulfite reductase (ferredoxin)
MPVLEAMPLEALEKTLEPLLVAWRDAGGRRSFGDFIQLLRADELEALVLPS